MPLDFPTSPGPNEIYTFGGRSWIWNGIAWDVYSTVSGNVVTQLNGLTGTVGLSAGSNITLTSAGNTITISSSASGGGISGPYVISIRGLTGAVGLTNGSGIGLSVSGNTLTVSNTGVLSINGSTGAITNVARTNVDNNFSAPQTINAFGAVFGIYDTLNSAGVTIDPLSNDIIWTNGLNQSTLDFNPQGQVVTLPNITTTLAGLSGTQTFGGTKTFNALTTFNAGISSAGGTFSALTRFTAGISASGGMTLAGSLQGSTATFTGNITAPNIVNSFNGLTGAVTGVSSIRGLTGGVGLTNGSGIGLSVSGNTLTVSNTGVLSIDGSTGDIAYVAKTNVNNNFSTSQTISTIDPEFIVYNSDNNNQATIFSGLISFSNGSYEQVLIPSLTDPGNLITLPDFSTTLAGLFGTQTFTGTKTFSTLTNFNAGISSAGGTFSALTRFTAGISASGATFSGPVNLTNTLLINGTQGSNNQVLTSTGSGITWAAVPAGFSRSINTITSSTTAGSTANIDYVYNGNTSGNINLTLPTAVSNTNRYTVKNSNIGILTVLTTSSQTIDGLTGYALSKQYQAIDLLSDNSNWFIV